MAIIDFEGGHSNGFGGIGGGDFKSSNVAGKIV